MPPALIFSSFYIRNVDTDLETYRHNPLTICWELEAMRAVWQAEVLRISSHQLSTQPHVMTTDKLSQQRVWHTEGAQCYPLSARQEQPCHACQAGNPGDVPKVEPGHPFTEPLCPLGAGTGNRPELSPERKLGILRRVWHGEYLIPCPLLPTPAEDQDSVWGDR